MPRRARAAALVAVLATSATGAFAWYSQGQTTPRPPAVVSTSAPTQATAGSLPASSSSTSIVSPAVRRPTAVRTCLESEESPGASRGAVPDRPSWITFDASPRVASDALVLIGDAAAEAREVLGETSPFTVHVHCDLSEYAASTNTTVEDAQLAIDKGRVAHVRRREMWIYGPSFAAASAFTQRRILYHEYFHVVQGFLSRDRSGRADVNTPLWLAEGSARYFEHAVIPDDLEPARRSQIKRWDALPTLEEHEESGGPASRGGSGGAYTLGFVASDYLVTKYGRDRLQHDFWVALAGTDWRSAFELVFGLSVDAFYSEFEAYRATLRP